ncbi:MAG TPA: hypothetical protein VL221_01955 [Bacteroidota bacterium]|nr:hypothetical protein [Bacteroidota bacterium]
MTVTEKENDIRFGNALAGAGGLIGLIAAGMLISLGAFLFARGHTADPGRDPAVFTAPGVLPPEPRFQTDPHADLLRLRAAEDTMLTGYGWVERDSGLARIPVARAMALLAARGLSLHVDGGPRQGKEERR